MISIYRLDFRSSILSIEQAGFIATRPRLNHHFLLNEVATFKWHGIGGRTVWKTMELNLHVVASFAPDIIVLQLGTNDLSRFDPLVVGSSIEDLVRILYDKYDVKVVCVCQTLHRGADPAFNVRVRALTKYLKTFLEPLPYFFFWGHMGFWNTTRRFLARDGVHLNEQGQYKLFRSLRGAVLKSLRQYTNAGH